ncbi:Neuronal growth regulator 1 [Takifugu flavidus]|uniref:Neuronal growth regulator 1 n=1 Tax=Takifugu flavidus TaxID=433684 RepID=A0A5C6MX66_9TELE|nr:Neuronal growth regulator 1 [Takifugu flavidus]
MIAVQDACVSGHWLTAIILSLCCLLPSCLPAGQTVDYSSVESVNGFVAMTRKLPPTPSLPPSLLPLPPPPPPSPSRTRRCQLHR